MMKLSGQIFLVLNKFECWAALSGDDDYDNIVYCEDDDYDNKSCSEDDYHEKNLQSQYFSTILSSLIHTIGNDMTFIVSVTMMMIMKIRLFLMIIMMMMMLMMNMIYHDE